MKYKIDKNYSEFIREIVIEQWKKENSHIDIDDREIGIRAKNAKNKLKGILESIGMRNILEDKRYMKGKKKIFPIHFQILCRFMLLQNASKKSDFVYKITHKNFGEITEEEINDFTKNLGEEFNAWFKNMEFPIGGGKCTYSEEESKNKKVELDEIFEEINQDMQDDETTEYIDELEPNEEYDEDEVAYLKMKFSILQQKNQFIENVENNLKYRKEIFCVLDEAYNKINEVMNDIFGLNQLRERVDLLEDYSSELMGTVAVAQSHIDRGSEESYRLSNKEKSIFLKYFYSDLMGCLDFFCNCIERYIDEEKHKLKNNECRGWNESENVFLQIRDSFVIDFLSDFLEDE